MGMKIRKIRQSAGLIATVIDALTSTSKTDALSANQGRLLNENKLDKAGGTITGSLTVNGILTMLSNPILTKSKNEAVYSAKRTDTDVEVTFGVGEGGINHGVFTKTLNTWLIHSDGVVGYLLNKIKFDTSGNLTVPGKVTCPTFDGTATTATNLNGGILRSSRSFLFTLNATTASGIFYKLAKIPASADNNAIQLNIRGSLGNWTTGKATIDLQISNRDTLKVYGNFYGDAAALDAQRIVIYQETDGSHSVYLYNAIMFTGPNTLEITWGGFNIYPTIYTDYSYTTTPTGTNVFSSTANAIGRIQRMSVLYGNASGTTGTVTLSESAANFSYLEIFYSLHTSDEGYIYSSTKVPVVPGRTQISINRTLSGNGMQIVANLIDINGTSITRAYDAYYTFTNGVLSGSGPMGLHITKVLGYR